MLMRFNQNSMRIFVLFSLAVFWGVFFIWFFTLPFPVPVFLLLFLAIEVIFFFAYSRFCQTLLVKELTHNLSVYQNNCDPRPALDTCIWQLAASGRRRHNAGYCQILQLNRATLLMELGQYEDAAAAFDTLARHLAPDDPLLSAYRHNQLPLMFYGKQFDEILALMDELERSPVNTRSEPEREWIKLIREVCLFLQAPQQNDGMEKRIQDFLRTVPRPLDKVKFSFLLGKYYLALNQWEKAQPYLQFVVDNGSSLAIAAKAHAMLDHYEGATP